MFRRGVRTIAWCLLFIACFALIRDLTGPATLELAASSEPSRVILQSTSIGSAAAQADLKQLFGRFDFVDPSSSFIGKLVLSAPLWLVAGLLGAVGLWLCPSAMRRVPATSTRRGIAALARGILVLCGFGLAASLWPPFSAGAATIGQLLAAIAPSVLADLETSVVTQQNIIAPTTYFMLFRLPVLVVVALLASLILIAQRLLFATIPLNAWTGNDTDATASSVPAATTERGAASVIRRAPPLASKQTELGAALRKARTAFIGVAVFSCFINLLMLTGSLFMLEVYDRVLPGRSVPTLVVLAMIAGGLFLGQGLLDAIRGRLLLRIGQKLDESVSPRVFDLIARQPLKSGSRGASDPSRDFDNIRGFLSGAGPTALFDLPWMPLYMLVIFAFHPLLGWTALAGAVLLVTLTLSAELLTRAPTAEATRHAGLRQIYAQSSIRNAEVLAAMGMRDRLAARWSAANDDLITAQRKGADIAVGFGAATKSLRMMLQAAVLGVGAYLVIGEQATAGIIIAASILTARALAPAELAIAHWRGFVAARQSWSRLVELMTALPLEPEKMQLPAPRSQLVVEGLTVQPPGSARTVLHDVGFTVDAGSAVAVIGPSACGKSSLARALVGVWEPVRGRVRLDGASVSQWSSEAIGQHIGYVAQDVALFEGTVAENIARFDATATADEIVAAAQTSGAHDMIVALPRGYETLVGDFGNELSAGQRQRIALARAMFRDPFLVVLDEPDSNMDADGDFALRNAILSIRKRGGIAIVIAHRKTAMASVDLVLALSQGRRAAFGPRDQVLSQVLRPANAAGVSPLKVVPDTKAPA